MQGGWRAWWVAAPLVLLFGSVPGLASSHGDRIWLVLVMGLAVLLSGVTSPVRVVSLGGVACLVLTLCAVEAWRWGLKLHDQPWLYRWGAWWDTAGWLLVGYAGTLAVVRHSPRPRGVPLALSLVLACSILVALVQSPEHWNGLVLRGDVPGIFPSRTTWAAWCAICLPVLWAWHRRAAIPALLGLWLTASPSAWAAVAVGWGVSLGWKRWGWKALAGLFAVLAVPGWTFLSLRLTTWEAVLQTIAAHPWGIGWGFGAYQAVAPYANGPILPHPASDWLMLPLRYGWWAVAAWGAASWCLWRSEPTPARNGLLVAWWLAAWQTSVSLPIVGALVLGLYLIAQITRREHGEDTEVTAACG